MNSIPKADYDLLSEQYQATVRLLMDLAFAIQNDPIKAREKAMEIIQNPRLVIFPTEKPRRMV